MLVKPSILWCVGAVESDEKIRFSRRVEGVAALYVLIYHMALVPTFKPLPPKWAHSIVMFGGSGVTLFFIVSAFSLCLTMPRHLAHQQPLKSFYVSRFFRIAPLFYFLMFVTYFRDGWTFGVWHTWDVLIVNASMMFNLIPGQITGFVWASWTIGVEILFYIVFPIIYLTLNRTVHVIFAFCISLLIGLSTPHLVKDNDFNLMSIVHHFPVFIGGMLAFSAYSYFKRRKSLELFSALLLLVGLVGIAFLALYGPFNYYWQVPLYSCTVIGLASTQPRIIVNFFTKFLGKLSYSIYLLHAPIIYILSPIYTYIYSFRIITSASFGLSALVTLVVVLPLALVLYKYVEKPGIALGRRAINGVSNKITQPT